MNNYQRSLAEKSYGYGHWNAKFWFIGLEERLGSNENSNYKNRSDVFEDMNIEGLCDCRDFHFKIEENQWHDNNAILQGTWKRLIWLFKSYLNEPRDDASLLSYQQTEWGCKKGVTCLTELDGLPFDSSKKTNPRGRAAHPQKDIKRLRETRIEFLSAKLQEHKPELVVMYGKTQKKYWQMIAGQALVCEEIVTANGIKFVLIPHPNAHGRTNAEWGKLAKSFSNIGISERH